MRPATRPRPQTPTPWETDELQGSCKEGAGKLPLTDASAETMAFVSSRPCSRMRTSTASITSASDWEMGLRVEG